MKQQPAQRQGRDVDRVLVNRRKLLDRRLAQVARARAVEKAKVKNRRQEQ